MIHQVSSSGNYFYCSKHMSCYFLLIKIPLFILSGTDDHLVKNIFSKLASAAHCCYCDFNQESQVVCFDG